MNSGRRKQLTAIQEKTAKLRNELGILWVAARDIRDEAMDISVDEWFSAEKSSNKHECYIASCNAADKMDNAVGQLSGIIIDIDGALFRADRAINALDEARQKIILKIV